MSKRAEAVALKSYPKEDGKMWHSAFGTFEFDKNAEARKACQKGYEQAEKDLALTWEDVAILITIYEQGVDNGDYRRYNEAEWMKEYGQDILRKFNEIRKK